MSTIGIAGNYDKKVRSDCLVTFEMTQSNGLDIIIESKVKNLFGDKILKLANDILSFYEIKNCKLLIQDKGALDFILAARIEAAIKLVIKTKKEFLLPNIQNQNLSSEKDKFRLSRLYLPGNSPKLMINAGVHNPNGIILDLEDSVHRQKNMKLVFWSEMLLEILIFMEPKEW